MTEKRPYVVILAGGEGQRLSPLTRALYRTDLPKQFAVLAGERSLLRTTIEHAAALTTLERISVIVTAHHEPIARAQLTSTPASSSSCSPQPRYRPGPAAAAGADPRARRLGPRRVPALGSPRGEPG